MTIRDKICEAGVSNLMEYLCLENTGGGGGDIIVNTSEVRIVNEEIIGIREIDENVGIMVSEQEVIIVSEDVVEIKEEEVEIDVVC